MFPVLSLLRGTSHWARLFRWAALMILLCRGLLSGAVMFDMNASADRFGLVMCSGYGPMFPAGHAMDATAQAALQSGQDQDSDRQADADMAMDMPMDMAMPMTSAASPASHSALSAPASIMPDGMPMHATADASDICAFSAALLLGIGALFVVLLVVGALPAARRLRPRFVRLLSHAASPFALPLSRAPPYLYLPA